MSRLTKVFAVHRFVAGGFGLALLLAPDAVNGAFRPEPMPLGERVTLQSWACFMIGVAGIVHAARGFPASAQRSVGWALLLCFILLDVLYGYVLVTEKEMEVKYREDFLATGSVFVALALAYAWGLAEGPSDAESKRQ